MYTLTKTFSPTMPSHWSLWMLFKISAMTVRERLERELTLSYTLKHLKAISAKRSFLYSVTLFNTLVNNTACDLCEKKFINSSFSMFQFKIKSKGKVSLRLIEIWPKIVKNLRRGKPVIISENTQNVINTISRKY